MGYKELKMERKPVWDIIDENEKQKAMEFADSYREFLSTHKTEREVAEFAIEMASKAGFKDISSGGDRVIIVNRGKAVAIARIGKRPVRDGVRIVAAHIDVPRIDVKQNPLYDSSQTGTALFDLHYYGGIKKYQWVARPLAIHGIVIKEDGRKIDINIGDKPGDPVFTIEDLLPHLSRKAQYGKKIEEAIPGEKLDLIVGSIPLPDEKDAKERIKLNVLKLLSEIYGIKEEDFTSAELEVVPAGPAYDVGFDKSMIGGYGHDDRICGYTSLMAVLDAADTEWTAVTILFDKEEIGSDGNTGAQSRFAEHVIASLLDLQGELNYKNLMTALQKSQAISADVTAAIDPMWKEVHDPKNAAILGYGLPIMKYTGHGGKYSANDAHAEFVSLIRRIFNQNGVVWQPAGLGKVDEGGGGTVAKYLAKFGMDVIDAGPALLSMHSPFEIASKADLWMAYKGYRAFFEAK